MLLLTQINQWLDMAIDYNKAEKAFDKALYDIHIEQLSEVLSIAHLVNQPEATLSEKAIDDIVARFQKQLKRLKKHDPKLYAKLNLSPEEEERFSSRSVKSYSQDDWLLLKRLRDRISELKRELYGEEVVNVENVQIVDKERRKHVNKRFNVREGWLPLR